MEQKMESGITIAKSLDGLNANFVRPEGKISYSPFTGIYTFKDGSEAKIITSQWRFHSNGIANARRK